MNYWVIHINHGQVYAIGPYKTREAAENRQLKTHGGQIDVMSSFSTNAREVIDEYKSQAAGVR